MKTTHPPHSPANRSAFTLVELMVSMTITVIIVTVLVSLTGVATDTWARSSSEVRAARQAQLFIDTMAKDLESFALRRANNFEWLVAEIDADAGFPTVVQGQAAAGEVASLTFLSAATDRYFGDIGGPGDLGGDISCASYRMRFRDSVDGSATPDNSTFIMYRLLVDPDDTFTNLLGQTDLNAALSALYAPTPLDSVATDVTNFVCENVHQFTMTFLVEVLVDVDVGGGVIVPVPRTVRVTLSSDVAGASFAVTGNRLNTNLTATGATAAQLATGRLRAVELSITVLSDSAMVRRNSGAGLSEEDYVRQTFHYSRVVELPGV